MAREPISKEALEGVLTKSARRCALCFGLNGSLAQVRGQIAHIDRDNTNADVANLAHLCMDHHDQYDSKTSQSKGFIPGELILYRDRLYTAIERGEHHKGDPTATPRVQIDRDVLEHDRSAFRAGDSILGEHQLLASLGHIDADHSYESQIADPVDTFCEHFSLESNKFLLRELEQPAGELVAALRELSGFLTQHFFVFPERQVGAREERRYCMYPDLNVDRGGGLEDGDAVKYGRVAKDLFAVLKAADDAYREYRRAVKRTLLI